MHFENSSCPRFLPRATTMTGPPRSREGTRQLEAALPISADIAALAEIGLDALAANRKRACAGHGQSDIGQPPVTGGFRSGWQILMLQGAASILISTAEVNRLKPK